MVNVDGGQCPPYVLIGALDKNPLGEGLLAGIVIEDDVILECHDANKSTDRWFRLRSTTDHPIDILIRSSSATNLRDVGRAFGQRFGVMGRGLSAAIPVATNFALVLD
jgi:hypothetical protein